MVSCAACRRKPSFLAPIALSTESKKHRYSESAWRSYILVQIWTHPPLIRALRTGAIHKGPRVSRALLSIRSSLRSQTNAQRSKRPLLGALLEAAAAADAISGPLHFEESCATRSRLFCLPLSPSPSICQPSPRSCCCSNHAHRPPRGRQRLSPTGVTFPRRDTAEYAC